jgi:hypothetical protein
MERFFPGTREPARYIDRQHGKKLYRSQRIPR